MNKNDELQKNVQNALKWEPSINASEIGVTAKDGVVTLSGIIDNYSKKVRVENTVKRVEGVRAIAEDITIHYSGSQQKNDTEIAANLLNAWKEKGDVPVDKIKVQVENGWVKLEGEVQWKFQEEASKNAIKNLDGVRGITNLTRVKPESKDILEKETIESALGRDWSINAKDIKVEVNHDKVKLTGLVHSLYQKEEAGQLAWNAPGVSGVDNELAVIY